MRKIVLQQYLPTADIHLGHLALSGAVLLTFGRGPALMPSRRGSFPTWAIGTTAPAWALRARLANRVQLTTDGHKAYLSAVSEVDFDRLSIPGSRVRNTMMCPAAGEKPPNGGTRQARLLSVTCGLDLEDSLDP
jgi:hypothetical protein